MLYQTLLNIFAGFGLGCFLAGAVVATIAYWGYRELAREAVIGERKATSKQLEEWNESLKTNWQKRIEEEFRV